MDSSNSMDKKLFERVPPTKTGINHMNTIIETDLINFYTWKNIYNGGGVAIGDINNDGLADVYLSSNLYSNKLYLNKGDFVFEDISKSAGVLANDGYKTGVSMADINGDGWLDIYVCRDAHSNRSLRTNLVYINNGDLTFSEKALELGLVDNSYSTQAIFFDYDLDNDIDLYLVNHPNDFDKAIRVRMKNVNGNAIRNTDPETPFFSDRLFKNENGVFVDVTLAAGVGNHTYGLSASVTDINGDGYPDLFIANDFVEPDQFMVNSGNGTFSNQVDKYFGHMSNSSMGSDFGDINNDGLEDLLVLDMLAEDNYRQKLMSTPMVYNRVQMLLRFDYKHQIMRNMLHLNNGDRKFSEIGQLTGLSNTDWSWGSLLVDLDNNGFNDALITNGIKKDMTNLDYIDFKTDSIQRAKLQNQEAITLENWREWVDYIPSNKLSNYAYKNDGNLKFENVSTVWGFSDKAFSNGAAYGDLDNDGDLDLVINNLEDTVYVYRNNLNNLTHNNYLRFKLKGPSGNSQALGTRVDIFYNQIKQTRSVYSVRGFLSSVEPVVHFGLGSSDQVDSVYIRWTDGHISTLKEINSNQVIELDYNIIPRTLITPKSDNPILNLLDESEIAVYKHQENIFEDFRREPMLPYLYSRNGPFVTKGDVNNDGKDDLFVGGAKGYSGLFLIQREGSFESFKPESIIADAEHEDAGVLLFDADGDGDLDLYVVSGGTEEQPSDEFYQDRLYMNEGDGKNWVKSVLPLLNFSGSVVKADDIDNDGDQDLFIGGRIIPGDYPYSPKSIMIENNNGKFSIQEDWSRSVKQIGLITDAKWTDYNKDGFPDLFLVGEWMAPKLLLNSNGKLFENASSEVGLDQFSGWWQSLEVSDIDNDGDFDLIAGNHGLNSRYMASSQEPLEIFANDFDGNGDNEFIITYYNQGERWPLPRKEVLNKVVTAFEKDFVQFEKYAKAKVEDLIEIDDSFQRDAKYMTSSIFINENNRFAHQDLPIQTQFSPVNDILVYDFNEDGLTDILTVGNFYFNDVEQGPFDASSGSVLINKGKAGFEPMLIPNSGFVANKEARRLCAIDVEGNTYVMVFNNDDDLQSFIINKPGQFEN
ncbi:MAG: VCBS repeat-containing protein [Bacteroidota bacterium]